MTNKHATLVALYQKPNDEAAFDAAYFETHIPLAKKMPGLLNLRLTRYTKSMMGGQLPYYLMAELDFETVDALKAAMASPEGKAAAANLMTFASEITTMCIAESWGE